MIQLDKILHLFQISIQYYTDLIGNGNGFSKIDIEQFNNLYKCPKYTGPLPEEQTPSCHDKSSYCDKFIREGNCGDRWLSGFCPYSCKKCKVDPNATVPPPTQKPNPSCEDTITNCHEYPKMCNQPGDFRDKWCRKSCNRCNTSCKDNVINCHELLHLCNRSDTIRNACKKSCGKCQICTRFSCMKIKKTIKTMSLLHFITLCSYACTPDQQH